MEKQKGYTGRRCSEERSFVNTLACIPDKSKWINNVVILPYLDRREAGLLTRFWRQTFQGQPLSSLTALFQALHQIQLDIHIPGKHIYNIFFLKVILLSFSFFPPLRPTEAGAAPFVFNKILESVHEGKVHFLKEGVALHEAVSQTRFSNGYWSLSQSYYFTSNIIASSTALQHKRQPGKHHNRIREKKSPLLTFKTP